MVKLSELIAEPFYKVHEDIKSGGHTHYWLKGGRGSTKSSFVSIEIILGMMKDTNANALILRKVGLYLKDSVYEQLLWAIDKLGVSNYWESKLSPLELTYTPTGQRIIFRGADMPKKIKSTKVKKGYIKYIWYEEVDEFAGDNEIRVINQSLLRGGDDFFVFYSFNPPKSMRNWVNSEVLVKRQDRLVHHSDYTGVPKRWLGEQFYIEADHLKITKPDKYKHEYLGEVVGNGGEIFTNLIIREITDEEIESFSNIKRGLDFGYAADPLHYTECHYDKTRRRLYIYFEIHRCAMKNRDVVQAILKQNRENGKVVADSEDARAIGEFKDLGLRIVKCIKGAGSVDQGIKFLQDLEEIIIDPKRCPNTSREFYEYELELDREGNFKAEYPDKNNHSIDAVRYAMEDESRGRSVNILK